MLEKANKYCEDIYDNIINYPMDIAYSKCRNTSIDYEIMEKSNDIIMIEGEFIWNDVGTFDVVHDIIKKDNNNNYCNGKSINIDSTNLYINTTKKVVALIGVNDLIVVETKDQLLICKKDRAQDIKEIVKILEEGKYESN